ncbi:MAG TPA: M48 family metalloprotease [Thermoanaerobaculia bacterium]|nr:M48 family metalloprotease [Thermoanaerobaculia bacterium]
MRKVLGTLVALCAALSLSAETIQEFDAKLEQQLKASDPALVETWHAANLAREAGKHEEALRLYADVHQRVPQFDHALRRQAGEEIILGRRDLAIQHARQALGIDRSAENLATVAAALVFNGKPDAAEIEQAKSLVSEAIGKKPNESYSHAVLAQVAILRNDFDSLKRETQKLEVLAPRELQTQVLRITVAASEGEWSTAFEALDKARELGLPAADYNQMKREIESSMPFYLRWWKPSATALGIWFGGFAILLLLGAVLSAIALRAARKPPQVLAKNATGLSAGIRRVYSAVLFLSCMFYYASIPIVMLLVLALGGGVIYGVFALGRIPVKLVIGVVIIVGVTVTSMVKSLFARRPDEEPGMKLDLVRQPRLRLLLDDVAKRIRTRAVDHVYLTPGTEVAVMQRGKGRRERCLILGIAAIDGMKVRPLKAVLGHEYGHFSNRDTAGGAFALAVRSSLHATAYGLATGGAAAWFNPAWLFVNGFNRVFLRISEGASRLQEVLADRWAVFAYGADAFEQGLRHVIESSVRFDAHVGATLKEVVNQKLPLANLYTYRPAERAEEADVAKAVDEALNRKTSAYDSHPPAAERFVLARALPQRSRRVEPDDDAPAWSLFDNPLELQQAMTTQVRANVAANYGVSITA